MNRKGEAKPGEKAKGTKTGNPKTTETRGQTKIRDQYSHYMFQRIDRALNRSYLKYHIIAFAIVKRERNHGIAIAITKKRHK